MARLAAIRCLVLAGAMLVRAPPAWADDLRPAEGPESAEAPEAAPASLETEAAREASGRRIAGLLRFFWDNEMAGPDFREIPFGTHRVGVRIEVAADGRVVGAEIASSSGVPKLDELALGAVRGASPLADPPPELLGPDGTCVVPCWNFDVTRTSDRKRPLLEMLGSWDYGRDDGLGVQPLKSFEDPNPPVHQP